MLVYVLSFGCFVREWCAKSKNILCTLRHAYAVKTLLQAAVESLSREINLLSFQPQDLSGMNSAPMTRVET